MDCLWCRIPMRCLEAPPSSPVYVCDNPHCRMNDVINPSIPKEVNR